MASVNADAYKANGIKTTEEYGVKNAATDTDIDKVDGASLLPEDMRMHWGWLVLAWVAATTIAP